MLRENIFPRNPRSQRDVHKPEFFAKEVRPFHLLSELSLRSEQFVKVLLSLLRLLGLDEAHEPRHEILGHEVDPDAHVRLCVRVGGEDVGFMGGVCVFEEFAENEGFVECFSLILDSGNESLGIDS